MAFIRPLSFIFLNVLPGMIVVFSIKAFLFYPKKEKYYFGRKKVPLTPGYAYKKKIWLIRKLSRLLSDYIRDTKDESDSSRISKWEQEAFRKAWKKCEFISNISLLPKAFKEKIRYFISVIVFEIVKQFFRSFVPYLMERYSVEKYVELLDKKLDMEIIRGYFNRYIFKYMLLITLAICLINGLWNMIIYFIIK